MEKIRKELEQTDAEKDETRAAMDAIQTQIEKVDEELKALYKQKDEKREAYWKGRYDFKI
jgi:peptidoglycan hydrolase CwlO-like protein